MVLRKLRTIRIWQFIVLVSVVVSGGAWPLSPIDIAEAANTNYTFSCTTDDINSNTFDDRDYRTIVVLPGDTATVTVNNCNYYYATGSVSPGASGGMTTSMTFTVSGAGTLMPYVAGRYGFYWTFVTSASDTTRPYLYGSIPSNTTGNVPVARDLLVSFNEYITPVAGKNISLVRSDGTIVETFSVTDTSKVRHNRSQLQLNPTVDLEINQRYHYIIDAGAVVDDAGNAVLATNTSSSNAFYTTDTIDPTFVSSSPANGATGFSVSANITLTFSEWIKGNYNKFARIYRASDNTLVESVNLWGTGNDKTITINPASNLANSTTYYLLVDTAGIADFGGRAYVGFTTASDFTFTTSPGADVTAPTVSSFSPTNSATGVATNANLIVTFSETVQAVTGKDIVVRQSPSAAVLETIPANDTSRVTISGSQVTVNPTSTLNSGSTYYVLIDSGAFRDTTGNLFTGISSASTWQFSTSAPASTTTSSTSTTTTVAPSTSVASTTTVATSTTSSISSSSTQAPSTSSSPGTTTSGTVAPSSNSTVAPNGSTVTSAAGGVTTTTERVGQGAVSTLPSTTTSIDAIAPTTTSPTTTSHTASGATRPGLSTTTVSADSQPEGVSTTAPEAPSVDASEVGAVVNGQEIRTTIVRSDNAITTIAGTVQVALYGFDANGVSVPVTLDGKLIVESGGSFGVRVAGFAPNSPVEAWLFSDPIRLGDFQTSNYGKSTERFIVPATVEPGSHRVVLTGRNALDEEFTLALGLQVRGDTGEVSTSRIVVITIVALALLGLFLPTGLRRRRR